MHKTEAAQTRYIALDYLRVLACFLVILYHVPQCCQYDEFTFNDIISRFINILFFFIGRIAVPLFFIISGYLLFPTKQQLSFFIKKRIQRVIYPTIFWLIFFQFVGKSINPEIYLPFISKSQHLWYMFSIIGIYLIIPVISSWYIKARYTDKLVFLFFGVSRFYFLL